MNSTGRLLDQRIQVLYLQQDTAVRSYTLEAERLTWAVTEQDTRNNLFSSIGIGARGVTFTLRKNSRLTLHHAFRWRGQFCFLTSITDGDPGFQTVRGALVEPTPLAVEPQEPDRA